MEEKNHCCHRHARIFGLFATIVFILMATGNGINLSYKEIKGNSEETLTNDPGEAKFNPMVILDPFLNIQNQLRSFDICLKSELGLRLSRITLGNLSIPVHFVFSYLHDDTGELLNDESKRVQLTRTRLFSDYMNFSAQKLLVKLKLDKLTELPERILQE